MFINRALLLIGCRTCSVQVPYSGIATNYEGLTLNPKFTSDEQKILNTLNTCNTEQLSRFDVTQSRIKNLENWKSKKGPFKSLADILEVDGLGIKVLEKLCESIVADTDKATVTVNSCNNGTKNRRQFITPALTPEQTAALSSAVGIHLGPSGVSWAKLYRDGNRLDKWDYHDFSSSPKKMLPPDTFKLAMKVLDKIPSGKIYIFESSAVPSPQANKPVMINSYNQQMELMSMLLALINTSPKHCSFTNDTQTIVQNYPNSVYYLRANLAARLFRTLMGTERISCTETVSSLLRSSEYGTRFVLPCTPVQVERSLQEKYNSYSGVPRELLGQALLLVVTFMELCVYKNPASVIAVAPGRTLFPI